MGEERNCWSEAEFGWKASPFDEFSCALYRRPSVGLETSDESWHIDPFQILAEILMPSLSNSGYRLWPNLKRGSILSLKAVR